MPENTLVQNDERLTVEEKSILDLFQHSIGPQLAKIQALVDAGWIAAAPGTQLIDALIHEITMLRSERINPIAMPDIGSVVQAAFLKMSAVVRDSLVDTSKTVQQHRYNAFDIALADLAPTFVARGRTEAYNNIGGFLAMDIVDAQRVISWLKGPGGADMLSRSENIQALEKQVVFLSRIAEHLAQLIAGGITPAQILAKSCSERAKMTGVPAANTLN